MKNLNQLIKQKQITQSVLQDLFLTSVHLKERQLIIKFKKFIKNNGVLHLHSINKVQQWLENLKMMIIQRFRSKLKRSQFRCYINWFITGSIDCKIIGSKKIANSIYWVPSQPCDTYSIVWCLFLNQSENLIFSGSSNGSIKVWTLNTDKNQLMFDYQLNKHSKNSGQVSMNEEKTQIVSFSDDKTIIVWKKKANERKFKFKQVFENLKNDNGFSDQYQGSFHIFKQEVEKFVDKNEFQINLRINTYRWIILIFFYLQIFIIKHYKYVNILSYQSQSFNVQNEPNDCRSCKNYGNITEDGNSLIVWNDQTLSFYVYELKYH
ncbi:unnamed protein product [Paramecium pentaurelia]|uniref:Uncharacterized protein n=1 Tax=Paramecium pentaurelia TaxID=43138 RepID=A0A8S1W5V1_9CILI|nr:unnamed protein product [Paramecium pentaurelia]